MAKTLGGDDEDFAFGIELTSDENYLISGQSRSDSSGEKNENSKGAIDYWPIKLSTTGSILWQSTIGGSSNDNLISIKEVFDGYVLTGHSFSDISGDKTENSSFIDLWVVKLGLEPTASTPENDLLQVKVYPNPTESFIHIESEKELTTNLYGIDGKLVLTTSKPKVDISNLPSGVYILKLVNSDKSVLYTTKITKS